MKKNDVEMIVGLFVVVGIGLMGYISIQLGHIEIFNDRSYYPVYAEFTSAAGLKKDVNVEISGVKVGTVKKIELNNNHALVTLLVKKGITLQDDTIASIKTNGLLGEKYISLEPGYSDETIPAGGSIFDTEPSFDLEGIIKHLAVNNE